jgi:uncharacterized membrane protein YkgB
MLWYGLTKPAGLSPAAPVVRPTFQATPLLPALTDWRLFFDLLGYFEGFVGFLFLSRRTVRAAAVLLCVQMTLTFAPFFVATEIVWTAPPLVPTTIGLYIIKNFVLVTAGLTVAAAAPVRPPRSPGEPIGVLEGLADIDRSIAATLAHYREPIHICLALGLFVTYCWSGLLGVAIREAPATWISVVIPTSVASDPIIVGLFGALELAIGIVVFAELYRADMYASALALVYLAMTMAPVVLGPTEVFAAIPLAPTFEGVFLFKDWILVSSILVLDGRTAPMRT